MAGESIISNSSIEQRAEELEKKQAEPAPEQKAEEKAPEPEQKVEGQEPEKKPVVKDEKGRFTKKETVPDDPKELRKWNTRLAMENAEARKQNAEIKAQLDNLASLLTAQQREKIDWKEIAKDPAKLQAMIEKREADLIGQHKTKYEEDINKAAAEVTKYESDRRFTDTENYPRWAELMPIMRQLSDPRQPDQRINFNQHPKLVLDALYERAQEVADGDPAYKRPEAKAPGTKTYSQEEYDAAVSKARDEAAKEQAKNLAAENKGASVAGMGKGATKGKPGEVNKDALWNMPMANLKNSIVRATEDLHGR